MMTQEQISELAKYFLIDDFTIVREYLQLAFLNSFYQNRQAQKVYFKGGTALRLIFLSPRFSEDLDFSTTLSKEEITALVKKAELLMQKDLPELKILFLYSGKEGIRFRIKYESPRFKYPQIVRLDFNLVKKAEKPVISVITTKFPIMIFSTISHLSLAEIFAEKISALGGRDKGRDFYDVWYLMKKGMALDKKPVTKKLLTKIKNYPQTKLNLDLTPFLPQSQRKILPFLKEELFKGLKGSTLF